MRILAVVGASHACALCDRFVETFEVDYQVGPGDEEAEPLHFHVKCYREWERVARASPSRPLSWSPGSGNE